MDKWFKDILSDKDPYHNRGRDQMRKKGGPEFECLWYILGMVIMKFGYDENILCSPKISL
jgi:hypothetical protein